MAYRVEIARRAEADLEELYLWVVERRIYGRDGAAARLGIKPTTLASRMKTLGIARPGSRSPGGHTGGTLQPVLMCAYRAHIVML
jgi:hypothetical protein